MKSVQFDRVSLAIDTHRSRPAQPDQRPSKSRQDHSGVERVADPSPENHAQVLGMLDAMETMVKANPTLPKQGEFEF